VHRDDTVTTGVHAQALWGGVARQRRYDQKTGTEPFLQSENDSTSA
jgi:hypothetical protein